MTMKCGYVTSGEYAGKWWEIERIGPEHYTLIVGGEFWTSSDNQRQLLDEVSALDGLAR